MHCLLRTKEKKKIPKLHFSSYIKKAKGSGRKAWKAKKHQPKTLKITLNK